MKPYAYIINNKTVIATIYNVKYDTDYCTNSNSNKVIIFREPNINLENKMHICDSLGKNVDHELEIEVFSIIKDFLGVVDR
jgi:hypothetical protein